MARLQISRTEGWSDDEAPTLARLSCGGASCGAFHLLLRVVWAEGDVKLSHQRRKVKSPRWREGIASALAKKPHRQRRKKLRAEGECGAAAPEKVRWGGGTGGGLLMEAAGGERALVERLQRGGIRGGADARVDVDSRGIRGREG